MTNNLKFLATLCFFIGVQISQAQNPKRFEEEIQKFKSEDEKYLSQGEIVFVGSSSIRFWMSLQDDFPEHKVVNRGFGGSHMSDLLFYLEDLVLKYKPKQVFIYEGDNDINDKESPRSVFIEAKTIVRKIRKEFPDTEIVFISAKPSISRWGSKENYKRFNKLLRSYAEKKSFVSYVDVWNPMLNHKGEPIEDVFKGDKLHMNEKGYQIWKEVIRPFLK